MVELDKTEGSPPSTIGPYRLARRLGQGGMGEVFLAWDDRLGRRVAVKRILRGTPTPLDRERLRREARAAARLSHPAVVQVFDIVEGETGDAIVLEYVEGRTLRALLAEGVPAPGQALALARQIAEGLAAAHAAGLVHRDLKAENVLVNREGQAKILDFGIAKVRGVDTLSGPNALVGTAYAMSPEQVRGHEVDARSDLFSFGVLLYELLTGISPFRGSGVLSELQRVLDHQPPPIATLRPELPAALSALVGRLLAKKSADRPASAAQVARELGKLPPLPGEEAASLGVGDTALRETSGATTAYGPPKFARVARRLRGWPLLAATLLLAAGAATAVGLLWAPADPPLRVLVLPPPADAAAPSPYLVASSLFNAALSDLATRRGLAALLSAAPRPEVSALEQARGAAAVEVLVLGLERSPAGVRASLKRLAGDDGRVLFATSFPISGGMGDRDLRLLGDVVAVQLGHAYPEHERRAGLPDLEVSDRGYAELLRVRERILRGAVDLEPELQRLDAIVRESPRFLEGHLLLIDVAVTLFANRRDPEVLARGRDAVSAALALAPDDPRCHTAQFRLAVNASKLDEAQAALRLLETLTPGDPQLHAFASRLAESRGDLDGAIAELERAAREAPSWSHLYRLAELEARAGRIAQSRDHLEDLLRRNPDHLWGLARLAMLELLDGDPARAEQLFLDLLRREPKGDHATNLGLARSLQGRHHEAATAFRQALAFDPGNPYARLNLADAELALGRETEARELYERTLESVAQFEAAAELSPVLRMVRAQCLAHLDRPQDALRLAMLVLADNDDDPELLFAASLVAAVVGERRSALVHAEHALEKGMQPRWFTLPAFGALRDDPELKLLLAEP